MCIYAFTHVCVNVRKYVIIVDVKYHQQYAHTHTHAHTHAHTRGYAEMWYTRSRTRV